MPARSSAPLAGFIHTRARSCTKTRTVPRFSSWAMLIANPQRPPDGGLAVLAGLAVRRRAGSLFRGRGWAPPPAEVQYGYGGGGPSGLPKCLFPTTDLGPPW